MINLGEELKIIRLNSRKNAQRQEEQLAQAIKTIFCSLQRKGQIVVMNFTFKVLLVHDINFLLSI